MADVCTCEAIVKCGDGDEVLLALRARKSQCEKFLGQELDKVKASKLPYCTDHKYPEKLEATYAKDCKKVPLEICRSRSGTARTARKARASATCSENCTSSRPTKGLFTE
jgi:hypothetical protein